MPQCADIGFINMALENSGYENEESIIGVEFMGCNKGEQLVFECEYTDHSGSGIATILVHFDDSKKQWIGEFA